MKEDTLGGGVIMGEKNSTPPWMKLVALVVVGSVAKALFAPDVGPTFSTVVNKAGDAAVDKLAHS